MVITNHWSGSPAERLRAYHVEIARKLEITPAYRVELRSLWESPVGSRHMDWEKLKSFFTIYKNEDLTTANDYGTYMFNHDPRDGSDNIEVASMCLPGGATDFNGQEPFTIAHAWCHAYLSAVISKLKNLDTAGAFSASVDSNFQNGPIYVVSTHGERAIQTKDSSAASQAQSDEFGYFFGSGDPDSRADLFCMDGAYYTSGISDSAMKQQCINSAAQLRNHAHLIKGVGIDDLWGLNGPETP